MRRKLVKHGPSTLIVSLPAKWIKEQRLEPGDEVEIEQEGTQLQINLEKQRHQETAAFDITNLDRTSVVLLLHSIYRSGITRCTLTFKDKTTTHFRTQEKIGYSELIHTLMTRFIGFEITREKPTEIEISQVSSIDKDQIQTMIDRSFHLLYDITETFTTAIKNQDGAALQTIEAHHDSITKLISFSIRSITVQGLKNTRYNSAMIHILASIDKIIDIIKYIARREHAEPVQLSEPTEQLIDLFSHSLFDYVRLIQKYDEKKITSLSEKRDAFKTTFSTHAQSLNQQEVVLGTELLQGLEMLFDLIEWRFQLLLSE